jgi:tetratricopeptide (TPR) repeat protein
MARRKKNSRSDTNSSERSRFAPRWQTIGGIAIIVGLVLFIYWPALRGGFVWDDEPLTTGSDLLKSPSALFRIWFTWDPIDYWPVTYSAFWLETRLFGTNTIGYHVVNIVLHCCNAILVWAVLRRLAIPGAFFAGLLFAVHPVNVESVAWIAQLKNTLSMFFFLLAALCYLKIEMPGLPADRLYVVGQGRWYWLSLAFFTAAMLSKGSVVVLPALLLLVIWWRREITRWDICRLAPFFVIGAALTLVNVWFQKHGADVTVRNVSALERLLGAAGAIWFYLWKAVLPINLNFVYSQWTIRASDIRWWLPLAAAIVVSVVLWLRRKSPVGRALLLAWGFFCVALVPVMGFVDVIFMQYSLVADHYQYIAIIAIVALAAAAGMSIWNSRQSRGAKQALAAMAVLIVGIFTGLSFVQAHDYRDATTLYQNILARNPECWMAYNNLAVEMDSRNKVAEAIGYYQKGLELNPNDTEAENNLGSALVRTGQVQEALPHLKKSIELTPRSAAAHFNLGSALARLRQKNEAVHEYEIARDLAPNDSAAHNNLAHGFCSIGMMEEGIAEFRKALALDPQLADAENDLGSALVQVGKSQEAIQHFERALAINPHFGSAQSNWGVALLNLGQLDQAIAHFQEATRVQPNYLDAYMNLAQVFAQTNRPAEAIRAAESGLSAAQAQGNAAAAKQIEAWLQNFKTGAAK